ncbi:archaeosortase A [Candidatus Halobonum tyrrellensis]|uniref:Exosortase EpsH-like protein n=1 Tax=Candidatus Halobonum tyrrellensis G22 TaxID=1324957 RepID=V4GXJ1_9EURY|nr:archaeosortase A [Candidatus Halobonum tyrrellensis]ESP89866.1 Exosortase EpsH-like protein [Candidatus Halobonum tyrrellensis G22]
MQSALLSAADAVLGAPNVYSDLFAWVVVATFLTGAGIEWAARSGRLDGGYGSTARGVMAAGWGLFAGFWLWMFPHFAFTQKSYVEGILAVAAVPACLYAGWLLWNGRDSLFVLSRAVGAMGVVYLPFETIPAFTLFGAELPAPKQLLIRTVTLQTGFLIEALGYHPELVTGPVLGYENAYRFTTADGHSLLFEILLACTGLGSIAIFVGLIVAVRAPLGRKLRALAVSVPVIWCLNLVRTTFIGVTFGNQYLQVFVDEVLFLFGSSDPYMVSFFVSDRILSQVLAVVALVGVTYLVVRQLPELLTVVEDVLYVVTDEEYDLSGSLDLPREPRRGSGL